MIGKVTLIFLWENKGQHYEDEDIGILKCRRKSRIDEFNDEVRGWKSSSERQECPPERTKTKGKNRLGNMKRKTKQADLEWDDLDIQAELKSFFVRWPFITSWCKEGQFDWSVYSEYQK